MDACVAFTFWLLWKLLLWMWVYKCLFKFLISILLGIYPEMKLLDHMIDNSINFLRNHHTVGHHFTSLQGFQFLHILTSTCCFLFFFFFNSSHPKGHAYLALFETANLFPRVTVPFYTPTGSVGLIQVLCTVFCIWCCHYFYFRNCDRWVMISHCIFNLHFSSG